MPTQALANDPAFQRIAKGIYTLRALAPEINSPVPQPKTKGQRTPRPPPPRFDPSALAPEPSGSAFDDAAGTTPCPWTSWTAAAFWRPCRRALGQRMCMWRRNMWRR